MYILAIWIIKFIKLNSPLKLTASYCFEKKFDDILARDDNSFLLHGESASFVSGWYKDIAMRRNYIKADENQDGFINQEEALNLRQDFNPKQFFLCIDEGVFNFKFAGLNQ